MRTFKIPGVPDHLQADPDFLRYAIARTEAVLDGRAPMPERISKWGDMGREALLVALAQAQLKLAILPH